VISLDGPRRVPSPRSCVKAFSFVDLYMRPSFDHSIGILQVPYKFVDLVGSDVKGFCHVNHGTKVRIEDDGHSKLLSIVRVSGKTNVSTELFIVKDRLTVGGDAEVEKAADRPGSWLRKG
jgi:hypothetical protein